MLNALIVEEAEKVKRIQVLRKVKRLMKREDVDYIVLHRNLDLQTPWQVHLPYDEKNSKEK